MSPNYFQGFFRPKHPEKYRGNANNIVYRSHWEFRFMRFLDETDSITWWASEELPIPYVNPITQRIHRYFPDFLFCVANTRVFMIEIKPHRQTVHEQAKRARDKLTYVVNQAKWEAARTFAQTRGWTFLVLTERELFESVTK